MDLHMLKAKVRGTSHIRKGQVCQDALKIVELGDNVLLAVADGHGSSSCPYSDTGSQIAVEVFTDLMGDYLRQVEYSNLKQFLNREGSLKIARDIDRKWKSRVKEHYHRDLKEGQTLKDEELWKLYGTTLLGMVLTPDFYFAFQIGDGDIIHLSEVGVREVIAGDALLGTETHSLSHANAWQKAHATVGGISRESCPQAFMLTTDGFSNSYSSKSEFTQTSRSYFEAVRCHGVQSVDAHLVEWLTETSRDGSGDDITLVMGIFL